MKVLVPILIPCIVQFIHEGAMHDEHHGGKMEGKHHELLHGI